ncbi:MAG: DUF3549 family protein [Pseudomonadales bacterium]|nr:DUF3549 family protein [Pseudomonadales bacterium]
MKVSEAQYRVFDMGRSVRKIDHVSFEKFEANEAPYPYPLQGHAWFALLFWSPQKKEEHQIWFIKFPLDEQGLLKQSCRDDFLKRTLTEVAQQKEQGPSDKSAANRDMETSENPWGFTPKQDKMATIHAKGSLAMGVPASHFYQDVQTYLERTITEGQGPDWQLLGVQGIADYCARLDSDNNEQRLIKALPMLPAELLLLLLPQLENEVISHNLGKAIVDNLGQSDDPMMMSTLLRSLAQVKGDLLKAYVTQSLASPFKNNVEILVAISGRAWDVLADPVIALEFLEAAANNDAGQQGFNHILRDVLYLPDVGPVVREAFRSEKRSEHLIATLGKFLKNVH